MVWNWVEKTQWIPAAFSREIASRMVRPFVSGPERTVQHFEEDWDNLILLDACRYDTFDACNPFDEQVQRRFSCASHTKEFLLKNVTEPHPDTVYITANPWVSEYEQQFAHIEHVWRTKWDTELHTVPPSEVTDTAIEVAQRYPAKRYVIHYMQPHYPFIGQLGQQITEQSSFRHWWRREDRSVWEQAWVGDLDSRRLKAAYRENLELALPAVEALVESLSGKSVITSDHGTLFGKRVSWLPIPIYGHPPGIHDPELTAVPWLELSSDERREVLSAEQTAPSTIQASDKSTRLQRLRELGYRQ